MTPQKIDKAALRRAGWEDSDLNPKPTVSSVQLNCPDYYPEGQICLRTGTYALENQMKNYCKSVQVGRWGLCPEQVCKRVNCFQEILFPLSSAKRKDTLPFHGDELVDFTKDLDDSTRSVPAYEVADKKALSSPKIKLQK